jgi:CrcB protein
VSPLAQSLWVALGAAVGANARYWLGIFFKAKIGVDGFPWATFTINLLGSFLIGFIALLLVKKGVWEGWHPLVIVGLLGGFTTFSAFSLENLLLIQAGRLAEMVAYSVGSCMAGICLAALGAGLAQRLQA